MYTIRRTRSRAVPRSLRLAAIAALALTAACASAEKRFEQGMELEQRGRPADAAERYIDALKKDPALADARVRLQESGDRAMTDYLGDVSALESAGRADEAADVLLRLDELRRDAAQVGVTLRVPADYMARRRATLDRAIDGAMGSADAMARGGRADEADRLLARAADRWEPSPAQRRTLVCTRADVAVSGAEAEMSQGRYRAAFDRVERMRQGIVGHEDCPIRQAAIALQEEALSRGTVRTAVFPIYATDADERKLPAGALTDLNDALETDVWMRSPRFVEVIDPREVRRELRRRGNQRQVISTWEAQRIGRALGADVVVLPQVDTVYAGETDVRSARRPIRTTQGVDTAYTFREGRQVVWTRVSYSVIDVERGTTLDRGTSTGEGGARFRRGVYAGDWRTLTLSRDDRELFQTSNDGAQREIARDLVGALSERFGREVFDAVLRRID